MLKSAAVGMFVVLATTLSARAHDYWLQPQRFFLSKGETTRVQLLVGDHFVRQAERPFQAKNTVDFQFISQNEATDLKTAAKDGERPVATIAPKRFGSHLVVMERDWSHIEIEAAKFNKYLEHEGLSNILELRRKTGEDTNAGRERYRRYLKALVQVGDESDGTYKRRIGHRLEILPHSNPCASNKGDCITVSVLFEGKTAARCTGRRLQSQRRGHEDPRSKNRQQGPGPVHARPIRTLVNSSCPHATLQERPRVRLGEFLGCVLVSTEVMGFPSSTVQTSVIQAALRQNILDDLSVDVR